MVNGVGENNLTKGAMIDRLIMGHANHKPITSLTILAYSIDHALINAGFESHLRIDYEQNLLAKENKHLGKELHQFLAEHASLNTLLKNCNIRNRNFSATTKTT